MKKRLLAIQKTFILSITTLVTVSVVTLTAVLVLVAISTYKQQVSPDHIAELVANQPEIAAYIESQKAASPHFVALATRVKQEQQRNIAQAALIVSVPVILISYYVGRIIAKKLLTPVKDSFAAQERFIQDAAHELRNPLAAMSASLEAAQLKKQPTETDYRTLLQKLERQTRQLIAINEDLLFLQKKAESFTGKTNISELTSSVASSFTHALQEKNLTLTKDIGKDAYVSIRPKDFEIILRNILDNAIKYSTIKGTVLLKLHQKDAYLLLRVVDSGIGIPEKEIQLVTKRFYRASNTGTVPGSGLGMALVQKVIDSYNGKLYIQSQKQKGTSVSVYLQVYTKN